MVCWFPKELEIKEKTLSAAAEGGRAKIICQASADLPTIIKTVGVHGDETARKFSNNSRFSPGPIILKIIPELSAHP